MVPTQPLLYFDISLSPRYASMKTEVANGIARGVADAPPPEHADGVNLLKFRSRMHAAVAKACANACVLADKIAEKSALERRKAAAKPPQRPA
jgi:hypothetical protein